MGIQSTLRSTFWRSLGKTMDDGLSTVFCEVEAIMNYRPLTTVSNNPNDLEPLTPNHLLHMKARPVMPPAVFEKSDLYLQRRWKQVQYISVFFFGNGGLENIFLAYK